MQIASLFARIGLQTDEAKLKSFIGNLKNARKTLIGVGAVVTGVSAAIGKITSDALNAAAAFKQFEAETGASAQELQRWQAVAEQTNSSAQAVSSAVRAIALNQERIRLGEGNISGFQLLGIDPQQDPFEILSELRTRTEGLSEAMQRNVLGRLGVGAELLQTIQLSQDEFDRLAGRAFIISPQAIETLSATRASLTQARRGIEFLKAEIAVGLAPQLQELSVQLIDFIQRNQEAFVRGFQRAFTIVSRFGRAIGDAAGLIDRAVRATLGWENALKVVGVAILAMNAGLIASPIGLITAGIILLIALLEDIAVYMRGGDSAIGLLFEQFPELEQIILGTVERIAEAVQVIRTVLTEGFDISAIAEEWGAFGVTVGAITEYFRLLAGFTFDKLTAPFEKLFDVISGIRALLTGEGPEELLAQLGIAGGALGGFLGADEGGRVRGALEGARTGFQESIPGRLLEGTGERLETFLQNNDININITGSSPREIGEQVRIQLQQRLNGASAQRGRTE